MLFRPSVAVLCGFLTWVPIAPTSVADMQVRYSGTLTQASGNEQLILRKFEALLLQGSSGFFCVLDDERSGCPWPESFGILNQANGPQPHLVIEYDGSRYTLPLPNLRIEYPENAAVGSTWSSGGWSYEIASPENTAKRKAWRIAASERRGRRQTLVAEADTGLLLKAEQDVFMGQGEQFSLVLQQTSAAPIDEKTALAIQKLQSAMTDLQAALQRRPDTQLAELSPRQIASANSRVQKLTDLAKDTPLQETVLRIRRDVEKQDRRISQTMKRQKQLLNKQAPGFSLNLVSGGSLESESLKNKTVVLHFWKYSDKPLSEPYGQVGYLEFLYNKRKQMGVEVVGVAMNSSLQQSDQLRAGKRGARKLIEFMNLSYPVGFDDGSLIREFGDPREAGGELPLWVVVSPAGKVVHYQAGFYEIDRREGLKELDAVLQQFTKE